jgi:hypothetical protein
MVPRELHLLARGRQDESQDDEDVSFPRVSRTVLV